MLMLQIYTRINIVVLHTLAYTNGIVTLIHLSTQIVMLHMYTRVHKR